MPYFLDFCILSEEFFESLMVEDVSNFYEIVFILIFFQKNDLFDGN